MTRDDVLAAICATTESGEDSSDVTMWAAEADTDGEEESDNVTANHSTERQSKLKSTLKMKTCLQCKGPNYNSFYRYCEKCYQVCFFSTLTPIERRALSVLSVLGEKKGISTKATWISKQGYSKS